jgi:hypothetical protein
MISSKGVERQQGRQLRSIVVLLLYTQSATSFVIVLHDDQGWRDSSGWQGYHRPCLLHHPHVGVEATLIMQAGWVRD